MIQLFIIVVFILEVRCINSSYKDKFEENLLIKPLPSGHVYTQFKFTIHKDYQTDHTFQHFRLFPRSLGETLVEHQVQELHLSLTQGFWRLEKWGYPERPAPPGAEIWALFRDGTSNISSDWNKLTNVLSGQFCASLNFVDDFNTVTPKLAFKPEGVIPKGSTFNSSFVRYSALPHEIVCTENLTPFRKLLPCGAQAGLSTLINALNVFNAHFVSLAVDVQTICMEGCSKAATELVLSVSIVFDPPSKHPFHQDWSLVKLFGSSLTSTCPLASNSQVFVDISSNKTSVPFTWNLEPSKVVKKKVIIENGASEENVFAVFDLKSIFKEKSHVNIGASYKSHHIYGIIPPPVFFAERRLTGYGQENGGISCTFYNNHPKKSLKILYLDLIPWYLRLYSHTLVIKSNNKKISPDFYHYQPAKDRIRPHHLEFVITLPAKSKTEMSIEFDFAFLKWTEYPPDANHGFYVGSAVVTTLLESGRNQSYFPLHESERFEKGYFLRLYTQPLLVSLPTPDFSMPYNVICLTCTVVALAFGPIHNITTKNLQPLDENEQDALFSKLKKKLKCWWTSKEKDQKQPEESESKKSQ